MNQPLVSIIMPLYNSEKFIRETLDSILKQTYKNFEVLITDDLSKDKGPKIVLEYQKKDSRVKYFKLNENSGAAVARNNSIEKSKGKYIAFLDSDDIWKENKLEKQIYFMEKNNYLFTYTEYEQILEDGTKTNKKISALKKIDYSSALYYNPIGCLTAIYNAEKLGKIYMPLIRKRQDYGLWLKILKMTDGHGLNENLAEYRLRKESMSANKIEMIKWHWKLYREIENLNIFRSIFHVLVYIFIKVFKIKEKK